MDEDGREAPFGMPARRNFDEARLTRDTKPAVASPKPAARRPAPNVAEPSAIVKEAQRAHEAAETARVEADDVTRATRLADALVRDAGELTLLADVVRKQDEMNNQLQKMTSLERRVSELLASVKQSLEKVNALAASARAAREQERLAAAAREKERARQAKIDRELADVQRWRDEASALVQQADYAKALKEVKSRQSQIESDEARRQLAVTIERAERLVGLRAFLVDNMRKVPFQWGWDRGRGSREDILSGDDEHVTLRSGMVPWREVSGVQFLQIVDHYARLRSTRRSVRGEQYLAAAIYCDENGAEEARAAMIEKALEAAPFLDEAVDRLFRRP